MRILTIVGARPQFIKAAAVTRAFQKTGQIEERIIHTGQHFDKNMSDIFFEEMGIPRPDYNLNINSLGHGAMTGRMLEGIEEVLLKEKPDTLLVYGDTNSTLAGALAASKLHIPVAHVEAGLRSFNMDMPEEINRILTDRISSILFCPTNTAVKNLEKEGFKNFPIKIEQVGDVMQDAALYYSHQSISRKDNIIEKNNWADKPFILVTIHRAENTNEKARLEGIVQALNSLSKEFNIVFPIHPRTEKYLEKYGLTLDFTPIEPIGYLDMILLLKYASLVITDSGGLQKEAYFFNKYCVTVRDQTEWTELIDHGYNVLVSPSEEEILKQVRFFFEKEFLQGAPLYGGGKASESIAKMLIENFI
jgi:UDP-GlcNAc3NAcA epimerase